MAKFRLAIIGGGPRALSVLERLLQHREKIPGQHQLEVVVIDPGDFGEGAHSGTQAGHLMINTLAAQITMYPPDSLIGAPTRPSFLHWADSVGYRRFEDGYRVAIAPGGDRLSERHHLPRWLLGKYLNAFGHEVMAALSTGIVQARHVRAEAIDIRRDSADYSVDLDRGETIQAQFVVLATGHGRRMANDEDRKLAEYAHSGRSCNPHLGYFASPYPVETLDTISADARVAVRGLGLTAHDAVSALTIGRGGKYRTMPGGLVYVPSGPGRSAV